MTDVEPSQRPILITGVHRSGTTWVGKMIAASPRVAYISEPLNIFHRRGVMRVPTRYWYTYICEDNEDDYLIPFKETLSFQYHLGLELRSIRSVKDIGRMVRDIAIFQGGRIKSQRPLLKDPFAIFSAGWFADRLGCQVVVVVRHPAAFASSLRRLNWPFDFRDLLNQPLLMQDWLEEYRSEMEAVVNASEDIIVQASLLWRMIYAVSMRLKDRFPSFVFVRHEELSVDPEKGYAELYRQLSLDYSPRIENIILNSSSSENPAEVSTQSIYSIRVNSRGNLQNWKKRLSAVDVERIKSYTADIASLYYREDEW